MTKKLNEQISVANSTKKSRWKHEIWSKHAIEKTSLKFNKVTKVNKNHIKVQEIIIRVITANTNSGQ